MKTFCLIFSYERCYTVHSVCLFFPSAYGTLGAGGQGGVGPGGYGTGPGGYGTGPGGYGTGPGGYGTGPGGYGTGPGRYGGVGAGGTGVGPGGGVRPDGEFTLIKNI